MQDITWTKLDAVLEKYGIFIFYNSQTMTCNLMMGDEKVGYIELNTEVATGAKLPMVRFLPGTTIKTAGLFNIANEDTIAELEKYLIDMLGPRDGKVITVQYLNDNVKRLSIEKKGDWIDMYAAETVELKQGEHKLIHLGVAMKLPEGYEAHLVPRSSTFKKWGIIQANHVGIIDNSYSGPEDWWKMSVIAMRDTVINKDDKICQFRIVERQPRIHFVEGKMTDPSRGGFGSTGSK